MITVVSCVWQRLERLQKTLQMLEDQTFRGFELQLINNNYDIYVDVDRIVDRSWSYGIEVTHNIKNGGPFSRVKLMHLLANDPDFEHRWFMTVDDDAEFGPTLLEQWWAQRDNAILQGWTGFKFIPNQTYWDRTRVHAGDTAHYLWGSNMFLSSELVRTPSVTWCGERWMNCDDLWLCFYSDFVLGKQPRVAHINDFYINVDNKDTYLSQHNIKIEFLNELRERGWEV